MNTDPVTAARSVAELGPYLAVENALIFELGLLMQDFNQVHDFGAWFSSFLDDPANAAVRAQVYAAPPNWQLVDRALVRELIGRYRERPGAH